MSFLDIGNWTGPAIVLAFLLGVFGTRWLYKRLGFGRKQSVNQEYFKGLNFLLNEETDKAIEVFIKALEVDSETVELHLALGGLFRRKGQVDRATRIHQNLIARPTLTDEQRMQAVHELAQDYYKAGWLDRAESLFSELLESPNYRAQAINGLCLIYQQEKEWQQAIDVLKLHRRADRPAYSKQVAHYYCELAENAIAQKAFESARRYLREARTEDPTVARTSLLHGKLSHAQGHYKKAITSWERLAAAHPNLAQLVVAEMIDCYLQLEDQKGLKNYLLGLLAIPKDRQAFAQWHRALLDLLGEDGALRHIFERVQNQGLSSQVAAYLHDSLDERQVADEFKDGLLRDLLNRAKNRKIEYTCIGCGFDTKAMYWFCQNCGEWESFR